MDYLIILAEAAENTKEAADKVEPSLIPIDLIWQHITSLQLLEALTFIAFGAVWLIYGWRVFKILVTICFGLIGLILGICANKYLVGGDVTWLALLSIIVFAVLSIPLMKWGVCVLGAISGGILTSGAWLAVGMPEKYIWAGALVGLIAGGMISWIIFKAAVILFTSLGGSVLITTGTLAVLYRHMSNAAKLQDLALQQKWFLPLILLVPMVVGIALQYKLSKDSKDFEV